MDQSDHVRLRLLLTRLEVAAMLAVSPSLVSKLLATGKLPGVRIGNCRRWTVSEVERFIESQKDGGANE
jgi:excisionase family DNA binding protein